MQEWAGLLQEFALGGAEAPFQIPQKTIPKEYIDGSIRVSGGAIRTYIYPKEIINQGVNCLIQKGLRKGQNSFAAIAIKRPRYPHKHLLAEALVQALARRTLESEGIHAAIPTVYDIYVYANEARFTMEWVDGHSGYEHLHQLIGAPAEFRTAFFHIVAQIAHILECTQRRLHFDHRDLKLDNIWIRPSPVSYRIQSIPYTAPFQVVLLDFGFACIGNIANEMKLNLGGVIPDLDSCPKEGRDLYHILNRLLEPTGFAEALGPELRTAILERMEPVGPSQQRRSHVLTSMPGFAIPSLAPAAIREWALSQLAI